MQEDKYEIRKYYAKEGKASRRVPGYGLVTLEQAREICGGPNSSSGDKVPFEKRWFIGYTKA